MAPTFLRRKFFDAFNEFSRFLCLTNFIMIFCCVLCFIYYTFHTHTHTRALEHTHTHTDTHVRVYATLHPQHRKTYYDDNVGVSCGCDCDAPFLPPFVRLWMCVCVWVSVGSSHSNSYYYYYMLVLFVLLRFTLVFGFYLFAITVCIFVCYFWLYFASWFTRELECALTHLLTLTLSLSLSLSLCLSQCLFLVRSLLPPTRACLARVSAVSFLCNNFNHVSCAAFCCNLHCFAPPTATTTATNTRRRRLPLYIYVHSCQEPSRSEPSRAERARTFRRNLYSTKLSIFGLVFAEAKVLQQDPTTRQQSGSSAKKKRPKTVLANSKIVIWLLT